MNEENSGKKLGLLLKWVEKSILRGSGNYAPMQQHVDK